MPSFCKCTHLSPALSSNQPGGFRNRSQGRGFCKEKDNQVKATHKILGYDPIQKSFAAPKHVIKTNDPRLQKITVAKHGFLISEGFPVPEGIPLVGSSPSHQVAEDEGDLGLSEEGFGVFDQANPSEDPSSDLGNPNLSEAELLSIGTSSRAEIGVKRKPSTSLFDLLEGQPRKGVQGRSQSSAPTPPPQPQPVQTRSSPSRSQSQSLRPKLPAPPQSTLPPRLEPTDPKRKRSSKGKEPMDGGKSHSSREEDEAPRAQKQLKIGHQGQGKGVDAQSAPNAWLPVPMLHEELLMEDASMRSFRDSEGAYVTDALERTLLLSTNMHELKSMRMQEVFLSMKRDEAVRAKTEAEFAKTEAETSKDKAEEKAYDVRVVETHATLKAQIPSVCRLYYSQVWNEALKRAGVEASSDLWKAEKVYYPPAICETAFASSEAVSAPQETETTQPEAAQLVLTPDKPTKGGELHGATETPEGLNPEMPQEAAKSIVSAQVSDAKESALLVQPLQAIPLADVSEGLKANPARPPQEGDVSQDPKANPA
ncbi:uncharacterized protein LOC126722394 [Quercus robur]|uniref:uncharacterized protein LOC126722394 n=1 Tax=Quercus robur TaxID=38942 RepID=UPI00216161C8|nr:uncharacterized protein LOC126722394 [Quercus robur]